MITVEGLDNTGKTTLVERLCDDFPALQPIWSIGNNHPPPKRIAQMAWQETEADRWQITDRSRIFSEWVYAVVHNGKREIAFDAGEFLDLLHAWYAKPQLLIYCSRDFRSLIASFDQKEQLSGVYENIAVIHERYETIMKFIGAMHWITKEPPILVEYNFDNPTAYELVRMNIESYLEVKDERE